MTGFRIPSYQNTAYMIVLLKPSTLTNGVSTDTFQGCLVVLRLNYNFHYYVNAQNVTFHKLFVGTN